MSVDISFPVLVFEKDNKKVIALDYKYLIGDLRFVDVAFKNVDLIDSTGKVFRVKGVQKESGIRLLDSIKMIGLMVKLRPIIEGEIKNITLNELKDKIFSHIASNPKRWLPLDTLEGLKGRIYSADRFEELIRIFK